MKVIDYVAFMTGDHGHSNLHSINVRKVWEECLRDSFVADTLISSISLEVRTMGSCSVQSRLLLLRDPMVSRDVLEGWECNPFERWMRP